MFETYLDQVTQLLLAHPGYTAAALLLLPLLWRLVFKGKLSTADEAALTDLNKKFKYQKDETQYGVRERWKIVRDTSKPFKGDCEDYALALLWRLAGENRFVFWWNMLTCKGVIYHCVTKRGVGHAVLRWKGHWVCNIEPHYAQTTPHKVWFPYLMPMAALKLAFSSLIDRS